MSTHQPDRSGLELWVKYQIITTSISLLNAAIFCLLSPYDTFPFSDSLQIYLGPMKARGPSNSTGLYSLAPAIEIVGKTIPLTAFIALFAAVVCLAFESDYFPSLNEIHHRNFSKALIYAVFGLLCINQLTLVQPGSFLLCSALLLIYDTIFC